MIYSLTGKILKKTLDTVVISCAGVGYAVQVPLTTAESLPAPGREGTVYTVMNVTENDVSLYGFATEEQRSCFKMLTSVSGVGPKAGLAILSIMTPERVALAASSGDHKAFTKAQEKAIPVKVGNIFTGDLYYDPDENLIPALEKFGVLGIDMEVAGLYGLAHQQGIEALAILTVSDHCLTGEETTAEERQLSFNQMIELALHTAL